MNLYYPPDTSATAKMAREVAEALVASHEVTVLCGRPSYDPTERRPWRLYQSESSGRVLIMRAGSTTFPRFEMKKRLLNYLSYELLAVPRALFHPCDVVLAMTDPPFQGIIGAVVALLKGRPYVYNIRDLYPDMAVGGSIVRPGALVRIWEKLHRWALRRADRVIVLGEDMRARIVSKGVEPSRVVIVRDGAEIPPHDATFAAADQEVVRTIRGDFSRVLLHAGNIGFYGAWKSLVTAARELEKDGISLVFVGGGAQSEQVKQEAQGARNIHFLEYFAASKIPAVLAAADAHVITVKRGLEGVVVPSKMYGILAAGKPILAVAPRETDVVSLGLRQGFAVAADPDRPEEIAAAARALLSDTNKLRTMGEAARAAAPAYDKFGELRKFVEIIEQLKQ